MLSFCVRVRNAKLRDDASSVRSDDFKILVVDAKC